MPNPKRNRPRGIPREATYLEGESFFEAGGYESLVNKLIGDTPRSASLSMMPETGKS